MIVDLTQNKGTGCVPSRKSCKLRITCFRSRAGPNSPELTTSLLEPGCVLALPSRNGFNSSLLCVRSSALPPIVTAVGPALETGAPPVAPVAGVTAPGRARALRRRITA